MIKLLKKLNLRFAVFLAGTVIGIFVYSISLITVPFLYAQTNTDSLKFNPISYISSGNFILSPFKLNNQNDFLSDTIIKGVKDTVSPKSKTFKKFKMKKSPWIAILLSAVIPGAGQFYNQSYWKVPILFGLTGYFGYEYYDNNKKFIDYRDQYAASQNIYPPYGDLNLQSLREFYRNQRDDFVWYFMIVYVVNLVDAYVDAQLFDFTVSDEKIITPLGADRKYNLNFKIHF